MSYELDSQCESGRYTQRSELCCADVLDVWETSQPVCLGGLPDKQLLFPQKSTRELPQPSLLIHQVSVIR